MEIVQPKELDPTINELTPAVEILGPQGREAPPQPSSVAPAPAASGNSSPLTSATRILAGLTSQLSAALPPGVRPAGLDLRRLEPIVIAGYIEELQQGANRCSASRAIGKWSSKPGRPPNR